jgi:hypothetical protein
LAFSVLVLMAPLLPGCGGSSSPPASPSPATNAPASAGVDDAVKILKGVNESLESGGPVPAGATRGVTQVGSHRLKTTIDVPMMTEFHDERAVVSFGGRRVTVAFDKGEVHVDDMLHAKLPAGTKEVEVEFLGGKLSIKADGKAMVLPGTSPTSTQPGAAP